MGVRSAVDRKLPPMENRGVDVQLGESFAAAQGDRYHQTLVLARVPVLLLTLCVTVLL